MYYYNLRLLCVSNLIKEAPLGGAGIWQLVQRPKTDQSTEQDATGFSVLNRLSILHTFSQDPDLFTQEENSL